VIASKRAINILWGLPAEMDLPSFSQPKNSIAVITTGGMVKPFEKRLPGGVARDDTVEGACDQFLMVM
jgi:hypothetical protein